MRLYHYTSRRLLPHIMREGLKPGSDEMPPKTRVTYWDKAYRPAHDEEFGAGLEFQITFDAACSRNKGWPLFNLR